MDNTQICLATQNLLHDSDFYYMICVNNDGTYKYINKRYAESFSYISEDFVGKPYHITMHPDDTGVCKEVGAKCHAEPGKLFPATIRKHNGVGGYIITQWEYTLIVKNNVPDGIFCIGFDITEFEQTKNLNKAIDTALENKNQLLQAIAFEQSHIVRAPLANIIGLVSILKNMKLGANVASVVQMLEQSSDQLDYVIKSIVNKIE